MRSIFFVLALTVLSSQFSEDVAGEDQANKEAQYYDKINEHLKKKVDTDDVEANMAELKRWLNSPRKFVTIGSGLWPVVEQVLKMESASVKCDMISYKLLLDNNDGLMSASRLSEDNYSLQRTDKLVQYYFTKFASVCSHVIQKWFNPSAGFGWKRIAYGKIEDHVKQHNQRAHDEERTMSLIKELLDRLAHENKDGAITDAARQIVALDSQVLGDDRCTYKAYEILKSNEAAVMKFQKQIEKESEFLFSLVRNRLEQHRKLCQDVYPAKFQAKIKELDQKSMRSLTILASEYYFSLYSPGNKFSSKQDIVNDIDTKYLQINSDFTAPEVIELMTRVFEDKASIPLMMLSDVQIVDLLPLNLKVFATESQPEYENLYKNKFYADLAHAEPTIANMINEYVMLPCLKYKKLMFELLVPSMHNSFGTNYVTPFNRDGNKLEQLGFLLGQASMNLCIFATNLPNFERRNVVHQFKMFVEKMASLDKLADFRVRVRK